MKKSITLVLSLSLCMPAYWADDADENEENKLVITATYRAEEASATATSISALSEEMLNASAEQHFEEVINQIPNLNWAGGSSRPRYFQIRGIGELDQYEGAPNPSVAMIIDDIDFSGVGMMATLFDVAQIEVLRGPQSARYGANAIAGMINVVSRDPGADTELNSQLMLADYGTWSTGVSVSGALGESSDVLGLVSVHQYNNDGFRDNRYLNRDDTNGRDEFTAKAKLHWQLNDDTKLKFTALSADMDNGYDTWALDNTYITLTDKPGKDSQQSDAFAARLEQSGDAFDTVFIATFTDIDAEHSFDGDWGNPDYWGVNGPYDFTSDTQRQRETNTQEVRFLSKPLSQDQDFAWVIGLYRQSLEENNDIEEFYNGFIYRALESEFEATTTSLYAQAEWQLSKDTDISISLRNETRDAEYTDTTLVFFNPEDTMNGGNLSLRHQLSEDSLVWASVSRGYKAGGFNISLSIPVGLREFQPEYLWNYEVGIKGQTMKGALDYSVSLFSMEREDVQISTSEQLDPNDPLTFIYLIDNAAEGYNRGIELDSVLSLDENWSLQFNLGYLDSKIDEYIGADQILSGREQAHAPNYTANLALDYRNEDGWFGRIEMNAKDGFYYSYSHQQRAESSELVNLKLGYEEEFWSYYFWARNVFDEKYTVRGFFFANEPPDWENKLYTRLGDPRHMGVTIRYRY